MYAQVEKPNGNKSKAVANSVDQKKNNTKKGIGFVDNRYNSTGQRKLMSIAQSYDPIQMVNNNANIIEKQISSSVIQRVNKIPRPKFTKEVIDTIKLHQGQHRRHIVMSSRMREAIWAYHTADGLSNEQKASRREDLQKLVGQGTLRTEMAKITEITHNSMGNLFPGKGSENTAIGFAVNPLYSIANNISEGKLDTYEKVKTAVTAWDQKGIFGFALEYKKFLGDIILSWLKNKDNHDNNLEAIAAAIEDFAFSCSFDFAYQEGGEDHEFPEHVDKDIQGKLFEVANALEEIIKNPAGDTKLYKVLNYLIQISNNYKSK